MVSCKYDRHLAVADCVLAQWNTPKRIRDVKIMPEEECFTQHRILVMDIKLVKVIYSKVHCKANQAVKAEVKKVREKMEKEVEHTSLHQAQT